MLWLAVFSLIALTAAWYRAGLRSTAIATAAALCFYALFGGSFLMFLLLLLLWLALFVPLQLAPLRQEWVSRPLLDWLQDRAEPEPAAVAVAERPFAHALMGGAPDWAHWLSLPQPALTPIEQDFLDGPVETFCRSWPKVPKDLHLAAAAVPVAYGGIGFSLPAQQALLCKLASGVGATAALQLARAFQCATLIEQQGSEAQKQEWLTQIARGATVLALGPCASAGHGGQMPDVAMLARGLWKGREISGLTLTFDKRALAHTMPLDAVLVAVAVRGHPRAQRGFVWVPRDAPGVAPGLFSGREVFVPLTHLLESADEAPAPTVPMAGRIAGFAERAGARLRLQPTQTEDEILLLARLSACAYTLESLRRCMPQLDSAALRLVNARYCDDGLRLAQRLGLTTEPAVDAGLETAMRLARNLPGAQALRASLAEKNPALALQSFDRALTGHAQHIATCAARSLLLGLSHGRLLLSPVLGALSPYFGRISRYSAAAGLLSAALPWLTATPGRAVVQRELAIVWGRLCAAASILRCFESDGRPQADEALALWALADLAREIEHWLDSALHALPSRLFSVLLRALMFPLGRWARPPRAAWAGLIQQRLQDPRAAPLCAHLFRDASLLRLRAALLLKEECATLEPRLDDSRLRSPRRLDRIHEALGLGLLSAAEAARLRELHNRIESCDEALAQQTAMPAANLVRHEHSA